MGPRRQGAQLEAHCARRRWPPPSPSIRARSSAGPRRWRRLRRSPPAHAARRRGGRGAPLRRGRRSRRRRRSGRAVRRRCAPVLVGEGAAEGLVEQSADVRKGCRWHRRRRLFPRPRPQEELSPAKRSAARPTRPRPGGMRSSPDLHPMVTSPSRHRRRTTAAGSVTMVRASFTTQPGLGHLFPLLPVAGALRAHGHEVAFAAAASFGREIVAAGHDCFAVGRDGLTAEIRRHFPRTAAVPPGPSAMPSPAKGRVRRSHGRGSGRRLVTLGRRWRPDVVVREAAEYGGCLAAELLDLPHAVVRSDSGSSSYADRHRRRRAGRHPSARRAATGPRSHAPFRYLQLSLAPPLLDEPDEAAAPTSHHRARAVDAIAPAGPTTAPRPGRPSTSPSAPSTTHRHCSGRSSGAGGRAAGRDRHRRTEPGSDRSAPNRPTCSSHSGSPKPTRWTV